MNFHVALAVQCFDSPSLRPVEPEYQLPAEVEEHPWWDCSTYTSFWSANTTAPPPTGVKARLHYGGVAVFRLAFPEQARIKVHSDSAPEICTKVVAVGDVCGTAPLVSELRPGTMMTLLGCAREVFVVHVNVDPAGEMGSKLEELNWQHLSHGCGGLCVGEAWAMIGEVPGSYHSHNIADVLRSSWIDLPAEEATLTFYAMWHLERENWWPGCCTCTWKGDDGMQVRVRYINGDGQTEVTAVRPVGGYLSDYGDRGNVGILAMYYESDDRSLSCDQYDGWTGRSQSFSTESPEYLQYVIPLEAYSGQQVQFELYFASDDSVAGNGFWVFNMSVSTQGGSVLFHDDEQMMPDFAVPMPPRLGAIDPYSGVPVLTGLPYPLLHDKKMVKRTQIRVANWSASWNAVIPGSQSAERHEFIGWSYVSSTVKTEVELYENEELCARWQAPFTGYLKSATLWLDEDKLGVYSIRLTLRSAANFSEILSHVAAASPGVFSESSIRFNLHDSGFTQGQFFMVCAGIDHLRAIASDRDINPFVELLMTPVVGIPSGGVGETFVLLMNGTSWTSAGPWGLHTIALRGEWVEGLAPTATSTVKPIVMSTETTTGTTTSSEIQSDASESFPALPIAIGVVVVSLLTVSGLVYWYCFGSEGKSTTGRGAVSSELYRFQDVEI